MAVVGATATPSEKQAPGLEINPAGSDSLLLKLSGTWTLGNTLPSTGDFEQALGSGESVRRIAFDTAGITEWDSGLLTFLVKIEDQAREHHVEVAPEGLPEGVRRLLALAAAVPPKATHKGEKPRNFLALLGEQSLAFYDDAKATVTFVGESVQAFGALFRGKARFRGRDLALVLQEVGPAALPIVTLISFLVGLIFAFIGAVQLAQFGAQIYVANLVGLAMAREMGAMMTAIIMAGRTGAAFAAQLGSMQVNEEIDAFKTLGIEPMEFLVLPRMLALMLMMPLLTIYANIVGILGGAVVGVTMLDLGATQYFNQTQAALSTEDFAVGLFKGSVFGVLIAIAGCMRGMQSGRSSAAVGVAATSAVVTGIVFIIVSDGIFAVVFNALGI